ncbi:MAG: SurA N-terminal domain-containing protein [Halobacteriovoraceae bacterium]|nr:SurA N-terminal domain-containing protein [Halobacteriovoraceae bacterium]
MKLFLLFSFVFSASIHAKLLDKTVAVVNTNIIMQSEVERILQNYKMRSQISPGIYDNRQINDQNIVNLLIRKYLIRSKLQEMGHVISNEDIENYINSVVQKGLGFNRAQLTEYLMQQNMTFNEYFEITRESQEFTIYNRRIIMPLVSITEQEVKNQFFELNKNDSTLAVKYNLVDFSISKSDVSKDLLTGMSKALKAMSETGNLSSDYKNVSTNDLGEITEDGLTKDLKMLLKSTPEGSFSSPILLNNEYHVFFVKKKDLAESFIFTENKEKIREILMRKKVAEISKIWVERESNKHYVRKF